MGTVETLEAVERADSGESPAVFLELHELDQRESLRDTLVLFWLTKKFASVFFQFYCFGPILFWITWRNVQKNFPGLPQFSLSGVGKIRKCTNIIF